MLEHGTLPDEETLRQLDRSLQQFHACQVRNDQKRLLLLCAILCSK